MTTSLNPQDSIFHAVAYHMCKSGEDMEYVARDLAKALLIGLTQDKSHREPTQ